MNKDPVLNYYALILSIALKEQKAEKFNFYYDAICPHLTTAQIDWIKESCRLQEEHSSVLLSARLNWYKEILNKSNINYLKFEPEVTIKDRSSVTSGPTSSSDIKPEVPESNPAASIPINPVHQEYQESLSHLRSVMNTIVDNQPQIKLNFNHTSSCRQQSISAGDVNENFTGPHISSGPSLNSSSSKSWSSKQKKDDLFAGFHEMSETGSSAVEMSEIRRTGSETGSETGSPTGNEIDSTVDFSTPLLSSATTRINYKTINQSNNQLITTGSSNHTTIDINDSDHSETEPLLSNGKKKKKKKKKTGSNRTTTVQTEGNIGAGDGPEVEPEVPMEIDQISNSKARSLRRKKLKDMTHQKKSSEKIQNLSKASLLEQGLGSSESAGPSGSILPVNPGMTSGLEKKKKRTIAQFKKEKEIIRQNQSEILKGLGNIIYLHGAKGTTGSNLYNDVIGKNQTGSIQSLKSLTSGSSSRDQSGQSTNQNQEETERLKREWKIPEWVEQEERKRRKKKNSKNKIKKESRDPKKNEISVESRDQTGSNQEPEVTDEPEEEPEEPEQKFEIVEIETDQSEAELELDHSEFDKSEEWITMTSSKKEKKMMTSSMTNQQPVMTSLIQSVQVQPMTSSIEIEEDPRDWPELSIASIDQSEKSQSKRSSMTSRKATPTPDVKSPKPEVEFTSSKPEVMTSSKPEVMTSSKPEMTRFDHVINICKNEMGLNFMTHQENDVIDDEIGSNQNSDVTIISKTFTFGFDISTGSDVIEPEVRTGSPEQKPEVTFPEPEVDQLSDGQMTSSMPNLSFVTSLADIEGDDHVMTSSTRNSTPDCNMTPDAQNNNNDVIYYDEIIKFQQHHFSMFASRAIRYEQV